MRQNIKHATMKRERKQKGKAKVTGLRRNEPPSQLCSTVLCPKPARMQHRACGPVVNQADREWSEFEPRLYLFILEKLFSLSIPCLPP